MSRTIHCCLSIRGALRQRDSQLNGLFEGKTGKQARELLLDALSEGKKVLPFSDKCEGFSYETGCPGHVKESV